MGLMSGMPSAPMKTLRADWRDVLAREMEAQRYNPRSLALAAELGQTTVSEWLNPNKRKNPSFESIAKVAQVLKLPMEQLTTNSSQPRVAGNLISPVKIAYAEMTGVLQAGSWVEAGANMVEEIVSVPIVPHQDFIGVRQYAWRVMGNSMNRIAKHDSYVVGVSFFDIRGWRPMKHGDVVVCQRVDGERCEYTLKRVVRTAEGYRLDPDSDDPRWQEPVWLQNGDNGEFEQVTATHLIIGQFAFLA